MTIKTPRDLLAEFLDAVRADGSNEMEIAETLRTAAAMIGQGAGAAVDLNDGKKAYVISWTMHVRAQNQAEAVEKAYAWMRAA